MKGSFEFLYPWVLPALVVVPGLVVWFLVGQRRYWRDAFAFSQVSALKQLRHLRHAVWIQRVLPVLVLLALTATLVGLAQPVWKTKVATQNSFLMLVMDISISMEATDLSPNRLEAARNAAIDFTKNLPEDVRLGLAFFAGNTYLVSPPMSEHAQIVDYLKSLKHDDLRPGTAIGDALLGALESLRTTIQQAPPMKLTPKGQPNQPQGAIILLTDGESNLGIAPATAVEEAKLQRVRVFTIGMGEEAGAYVRGGIFTHLDEPTLMSIARETGGSYYRARSFNDFKEIYREIGEKTLHYEEKTLSLMPWCLGVASLCLLGAFGWAVQYRRF